MLYKCSGKYIDIYFSFKITFLCKSHGEDAECFIGQNILTYIYYIYFLSPYEMVFLRQDSEGCFNGFEKSLVLAGVN